MAKRLMFGTAPPGFGVPEFLLAPYRLADGSLDEDALTELLGIDDDPSVTAASEV